tara:strand:- start:28714 stop:29568 length:855 start_codon:yes stop_codon:yes gene_type:complete
VKRIFWISAILFGTCLAGLYLYRYYSLQSRLAEIMKIRSNTETVASVDLKTLDGLPLPVQRYFRLVLRDGQPMVRTVRMHQKGELMTDPQARDYISFEAEHIARSPEPAFLWNATMKVLPVLGIQVIDSLNRGTGASQVLFLSTFTLGSQEDVPELNSGALYRYLAESVWYPTALLPENGVIWEGIDANRARATLKQNGISATLEFRFNERGEIQGIYTEDRYGLFDGEFKKYPWEGRFRDYREVDGMLVPSYGEVGWHLPSGFWLFWKGHIQNFEYVWHEDPE